MQVCGKMRLMGCCCGCSLRTGTLIILWLNLLTDVSNIVNSIVTVCQLRVHLTFLHSSLLAGELISLVAVICALVGVYKYRPSYMLPFIGICTAYIIGIPVCMALMWIGSDSVQVYIIDIIIYYVQNWIEIFAEEIGVLEGSILLTIGFAINCYFLSVIYSCYKQIRDGDECIFNRNPGAVHITQASQPKNNFNGCPPA